MGDEGAKAPPPKIFDETNYAMGETKKERERETLNILLKFFVLILSICSRSSLDKLQFDVLGIA